MRESSRQSFRRRVHGVTLVALIAGALAPQIVLGTAPGKPYLYIVEPRGSTTTSKTSIDIDIMLKDPDRVVALQLFLDDRPLEAQTDADGAIRLESRDRSAAAVNVLRQPVTDARFRASVAVATLGEHELRAVARDSGGMEAVKAVTFARVSREEIDARKREAARLEEEKAAERTAAVEAEKAAEVHAYKQRITSSNTKRGGHKVVKAIDAALDWLQRHQHPEGHWSCGQFTASCDHGEACVGDTGYPAYDAGITGLATLAFLGAGHTHRHGEYRDTVMRALQWLVSNQDKQGCVGMRLTSNFTYSHAIASQAVIEAYAMTRDPNLAAPSRAAVRFTFAAQNPYKAWRYGIRPGDNDTSVTAWMIQTLASARDAGLEIKEDAIAQALYFVQEMTDEDGHVGYTSRGQGPVRMVGLEEKYPAESSAALTAAGMLSHLKFPGDDTRRAVDFDKGAARCLARLPSWERPKIDLYYWYYATYFLHAYDEKQWSTWNSRLTRLLLDKQRDDSGCARGSWDPIGAWGEEGGRIYSTALSALCLEAPVRYEPAEPR